MKTETGHPPIRSRDMDPQFNIRIVMWERAGGGAFPSPAQVEAMRRDHAVYMAGSGRINIAGLRADTIQPFVQALTACLKGDA